MLIVLFLY